MRQLGRVNSVDSALVADMSARFRRECCSVRCPQRINQGDRNSAEDSGRLQSSSAEDSGRKSTMKHAFRRQPGPGQRAIRESPPVL